MESALFNILCMGILILYKEAPKRRKKRCLIQNRTFPTLKRPIYEQKKLNDKLQGSSFLPLGNNGQQCVIPTPSMFFIKTV